MWISAASYVLLSLLVFGLSASVDVRAFREKLQRRNGIAIGLCCQFFLLPLVAYITVLVFRLDKIIGMTLLIVASSPGGSYSNLWCSLFNADLALSVAMTCASTIASAVMLPLNLLLYINLAYSGTDATKYLDWAALFTSIGLVVLSVALGLFVSARASETTQRRCTVLGNLAGVVLIGFSAAVGSRDKKEPLWNKPPSFYGAVATPAVAALALAVGLTSLPGCGLARPERVAVAIETAYRMFQGDDQTRAVAVPLFYGTVEIVLLACFSVYAWKSGWTYAPARAADVLSRRKAHVAELVEAPAAAPSASADSAGAPSFASEPPQTPRSDDRADLKTLRSSPPPASAPSLPPSSPSPSAAPLGLSVDPAASRSTWEATRSDTAGAGGAVEDFQPRRERAGNIGNA